MQTPNISWLFETNALRIAPDNSPFWYTSGLIGPYYINTHFVCGGEQKATDILAFIDENQDDISTFPKKILEKLEEVYDTHEIYRHVVDLAIQKIRAMDNFDEINFISGGQRRDWFLSPIIAKKLDLPALYIYNNKSVFDEEGDEVVDIEGAGVLNTADLLTVGSSYTSKWIPAIADIGGTMIASFTIVDRGQGGRANLEADGVVTQENLFFIDEKLFDQARDLGLINPSQYQLLLTYLKDPHAAMKAFLEGHPEFLEKALESDLKTKKRAQKLVDGNLYSISS